MTWRRGTPATVKREALPQLGIAIEYPAHWVTDVAPMPYATCNTCTVVGPRQADHPYGIQLYQSTHQLGCQLTCYLNIRALAQGPTYTVDAGGSTAFRQEFERQQPLDGDPDRTSYREILTVVPLVPIDGLTAEADVPAVFIDAFYRYGDLSAEAQTREALAHLLASLDLSVPP
jgi:hypothetical protein